jgi:hypothetical protein
MKGVVCLQVGVHGLNKGGDGSFVSQSGAAEEGCWTRFELATKQFSGVEFQDKGPMIAMAYHSHWGVANMRNSGG